MTPPRQITPDTPFDISMRTLARTFRLLPTREINNLFLYLLGVSAARYGVRLHGLAVMATHYHLQGNDRDGKLPKFTRYLHSLFARAVNCHQGLDDKVWSGDGYNLVRPQSANDMLARIVYGAANPAAAGIVNHAEDYPGVVIRPQDIGRTITATRPDFFFRTSMPATVELRFEIPDAFAHMERDAYVAMLERALSEREWQHRNERKAAGQSVMGAKRCRAIALGRRSRSYEQWFQLRPTIAAKMKSDRIAAIRALLAFRDHYRAALTEWRSGNHAVVFPVGTWWMHHFAGAAVG